MSTVLIGVDASERSKDAVAFARKLADASDARLVLANAYPYSELPLSGASPAFREHLRDDALKLVREHLEGLPSERSDAKIVADTSPARALHSLAEAEDAALVVVGSSHTGRTRRVLPGSTGEKLIQGSPCAVAVVPKDYRTHAAALRRVGVAYNGTREARAAVFSAAELARGLGAELEAIGVADAMAHEPLIPEGVNVATLRAQVDRNVQESLDALVGELPDGVAAGSKRLTGDPSELLAAYSQHLDLLVLGSRGYGPLRAVLAGGVSGRVIRNAHCPVIIVPRGVESALGRLFGTSGA